jgi:hypothetical protein
MSVLELKQEITRLNKRSREEIHAYLVHLKHATPEWRQAAARRIRGMKNGKGVTALEMENRLR